MSFVKPNAVVQDRRAEADKDDELHDTTARNLHHIQKQLKAKGHSIEDVIAAAAKNAFGVTIQPHAPKPKDEQPAQAA